MGQLLSLEATKEGEGTAIGRKKTLVAKEEIG
jgi:hypothetical protein